jgi:hypothetical protein
MNTCTLEPGKIVVNIANLSEMYMSCFTDV